MRATGNHGKVFKLRDVVISSIWQQSPWAGVDLTAMGKSWGRKSSQKIMTIKQVRDDGVSRAKGIPSRHENRHIVLSPIPLFLDFSF